MNSRQQGRYLSTRPAVLGLAKVLMLAIGQAPLVQAVPLHLAQYLHVADELDPKPADDPSLWIYLSVAAILVLLGGAFAGLTIALMGQDEITLQVLIESGEGSEKKSADKVLNLLKKGKHWVLVTLLLSNVITNETLPIVLDRSLGGGWPAVLGSTVLIVIFGEIVPQSICVRYGLPIGAWMAPFVLGLMYIMSPVAWPTAKLLDWLLGEEHGTTYKKAGLKTLVSLHRNLGEVGQRLHADEVTIISAVLDLKEKSIGTIMTPMDDVFTLSLDDVLDESTVNDILAQGYSRIPVHHPDNEQNFVGMLLVKMLISYDPEDAKPVRDFALATLPETRPNTSCLDIINFFQEGKSHMVLVSESPGTDHGALGVVTLEDVIEELIGEEIVDESDVFVDVHRAIRRLQPAPRNRVPHQVVTPDEIISAQTSKAVIGELINIDEDEVLKTSALQKSSTNDEVLRQKSAQRRPSGNSASVDKKSRLSTNMEEAREHAKHLGPSNLASRPKTTRFQSIKIKPGAENSILSAAHNPNGRMTPVRQVSEFDSDYGHGIGEGQLKSAGLDASDGVQALREDYGTVSTSLDSRRPRSVHKGTQAASPNEEGLDENSSLLRPKAQTHASEEGDTVGDLPDKNRSRSPMTYSVRGPARSGSITENIVDTNGIRKVVLETTSSSDSDGENEGDSKKSDKSSPQLKTIDEPMDNGVNQADAAEGEAMKKRRRRKKRTGNKEAESQS